MIYLCGNKQRLGWVAIPLLTAILASVASFSLAAQHVPTPSAGGKLAETWCSTGVSKERGDHAALADRSFWLACG